MKRANCLWSWKGLQRVELVIKRGNCHWKNRKRPATLLRRSQHGEASAPSHIQPPRPAIHTGHSHRHRSWLADKRRPGRVTTLRSLPCSPLYHLSSLATLAFAARRLSRQLVPMLSRAGLCTSGASAAAAAAARPAAPRLAGSGALRQALQFRGLRGAALAPAQLRALGLMRSTAAGRQASRVYAVAAPAEVCQSGLWNRRRWVCCNQSWLHILHLQAWASQLAPATMPSGRQPAPSSCYLCCCRRSPSLRPRSCTASRLWRSSTLRSMTRRWVAFCARCCMESDQHAPASGMDEGVTHRQPAFCALGQHKVDHKAT